MTIQEIRELPSAELEKEIEKTRAKVFKMRFQGKGKDLENPGEYKALRKEIARIRTILRERQIPSLAGKRGSAKSRGGDA
jgi:large subunit ribosomal protein L29